MNRLIEGVRALARRIREEREEAARWREGTTCRKCGETKAAGERYCRPCDLDELAAP